MLLCGVSVIPRRMQMKSWVHMFHSHDPSICEGTQCPDLQEWQCLPWSKCRCWQCVQTLSTSFSQTAADGGCSHIDDIRTLLLIHAMYSKCTELLACCWWASLGGHSIPRISECVSIISSFAVISFRTIPEPCSSLKPHSWCLRRNRYIPKALWQLTRPDLWAQASVRDLTSKLKTD